MNIAKLLVCLIFGAILLFRLTTADPTKSDPKFDLGATQRFYLTETAKKILPEPQSSLLTGILLGEKSNLPNDFRKALNNTSTTHIVVASGQNLTFVAGFFLVLAPLIGRKKAVLLSLTASIFFLFLAGFQIPILRAAIMLGIASLAKLINREADTWWVLLITVTTMLIFRPSWLYSISFQLSVLATIAVTILAPELIKATKFLPNVIKQDLLISLSAQLLTLPIIASNFYQVSISGIIVNALILWTIPLIMLSGTLALLVGWLNTTLGQIVALIPGALLTYFVYIVTLFSSQFGSIIVGTFSSLVWIGYYLLVLGAYLYIKKLNHSTPNPDLSS